MDFKELLGKNVIKYHVKDANLDYKHVDWDYKYHSTKGEIDGKFDFNSIYEKYD